MNELSTASGEIRYCKYSSHCGEEVNYIEISCTAKLGFFIN